MGEENGILYSTSEAPGCQTIGILRALWAGPIELICIFIIYTRLGEEAVYDYAFIVYNRNHGRMTSFIPNIRNFLNVKDKVVVLTGMSTVDYHIRYQI